MNRSKLILLVFFAFSFQVIQAKSEKNEEYNQYYNKAKNLFIIHEYAKSLFEAQHALSYYKNEKDKRNIAKTFKLLGDIYSENNELTNAVDYYLKSIIYFEEQKDYKAIAEIYIQLATINLKIENYSKSINYLNFAKSIYKKKPKFYAKQLIETTFFLGIAHGSNNELDSALYYFNKCSAYYLKTKNSIQYAGLLTNIGAIYSKKNQNALALDFYQKALGEFTKINNERGIGVTLSNIAFIYQKTGQNQLAITNYTNSIKLLSKTNNEHYLLNNYSNLSELYRTQGDFRNAYQYSELYLTIKEKLSNEEILGKIAEQEKKYELKKKDNEYKLREKDNELKRKTLWFTLGGTILIILILILIYFNLRVSYQKTKLKEELLSIEKNNLAEELVYKNKELEKFALTIVEKNEFLDKLKLDVKDLMKNPNDLDKIKNMSMNLYQNQSLDRDREKFEIQLDENLKSFFHKLDQKFPDLTKSEKRLASLLVLDLSTKDIATVLNVSVDGIKKSRYRLRKKLNLEIDTDLSDFIKNI